MHYCLFTNVTSISHALSKNDICAMSMYRIKECEHIINPYNFPCSHLSPSFFYVDGNRSPTIMDHLITHEITIPSAINQHWHSFSVIRTLAFKWPAVRGKYLVSIGDFTKYGQPGPRPDPTLRVEIAHFQLWGEGILRMRSEYRFLHILSIHLRTTVK